MLSHFGSNLRYRFLALYENLVGHTEFLSDGQYHIVVLISLVHIDTNPVFAAFECLAEGRHAE